MPINELTYTWYSDPGHAWLKVPLPELKVLGILGDISAYSYYYAGQAYLEEDCDAGVFINALRELGYTVKTTEVYQEKTRIRDYPSIKAVQS